MLSSGTKLGTYEITRHIGSGGMGDVYQAHDTKLGRDVAIKVLPEQFARDPERLARFQREAKMLAALNHPNIAAIYGLEQSDSTHYLVMELVPGETLRERVAGERPVPVEEALNIAKQIAEALEAAHGSEKGIIHRDLKPANVKVTPEGRVKVLDFGLAKAFANDPGSDDPSNSPTLSALPTQQGVIMGTAAYMSPEQARGKTVDKRTDIWAFGCVFYELLTGKRAFPGEDVTEILAGVLTKEPSLDALPANTPPAIRTLLRRCLRKDHRQRLQDATGVRIEIEEALAAAPMEPAPTAPASKSWRQVALWSLASSVAVGAVATFVAWTLMPEPPAPPISRFTITLPPGDRLAGLNHPAVALSPDGRHLAYVATRDDAVQQVFLRAMESQEATPVPGTQGAVSPFFSPDGQWLGFFAGGKLKKVSVNGGAAITLADAPDPRGASWSSQGTIIFLPLNSGPMQQVSDSGGAPQPLAARFETEEDSYRWPELLPGGNAVFFVASLQAGNWTNAQVAVQSLATGERRNLIRPGTQPHYAQSGHLIYVQGNTLMAIPFDSQRLQTTGTAVPVVEDVLSGAIGSGQHSLSTTGSLVYVSGMSQATQSTLVWVSRNGTEQPVAAPARAYVNLRLAPDGRRVAIGVEDGPDTQIWLYDFARETLTRFTFDGSSNDIPVWTPDGRRIVFASEKEGPQNLFWQMADGTGGLERLTIHERSEQPRSWSADGQLLAFVRSGATTLRDIWVLRLADRKAEPFLQTRFTEGAAQFSTDGRWLAYVSDESGRPEIYVRPYPGPGGKWLISTEGGTESVWNPNGRELFYRNGNKMMAVDIVTQPAFSVGKARTLFERQYRATPFPQTTPAYDVSSDGQRFLMLKQNEQGLTQINVVLNWFEELKRRVPVH